MIRPDGARRSRRMPRLWFEGPGAGAFPFMLWERVGEICELTGRWQRAEAVYRRNLEASMGAGLAGLAAASSNSLGWVLHRRGRDAEAQSLYQRSRQLYRELGDVKGLSKTLGLLGGVCYFGGRYAQAARLYLRRLALSRRIGDIRGICAACNNLGNVAGEQGRHDASYGYYRRALDLAKQSGDLCGQANILGNIGVVHWSKGDYPAALEWFGRQAALAGRVGDKHTLCSAIANTASVWVQTGDFDRALECIERRTELARELDDSKGLSIVLDYRAQICRNRGLYPEAERWHREAIMLGERCGAKYHLCGYLLGLATLYEETGRLEEAREHNRQALAMADGIEERQVAGDCRLLALRIDAHQDRLGAVRAMRRMLAKEPDQARRAEINYWLYRLAGDGTCRAEALRLFQQLVALTPNHEYRSRIGELERGQPDSAGPAPVPVR